MRKGGDGFCENNGGMGGILREERLPLSRYPLPRHKLFRRELTHRKSPGRHTIRPICDGTSGRRHEDVRLGIR